MPSKKINSQKKKNLENGSSVVRIFMDFVMALNVVCVLVDVAIKMQPVASIRKKKKTDKELIDSL